MSNFYTVFIDTDAFVASVKENDSNHKKTVEIFSCLKEKPTTFITSNYVFAEAVTVISLRVGRKIALKYIKEIKSKKAKFHIEWITPEIEALAIEKYKKQTSKNVSFTDCTNMAILEKHNIGYVFSFDNIYKKNNYKYAEEID